MSSTLKSRDEDSLINEMLRIVLSHHWDRMQPDHKHNGQYETLVMRGIECVQKTREMIDDYARAKKDKETNGG